MAAVILMGVALPALAAAPRVMIDIGPTVECREAPSPGPSATNEKIVEATFHFSVLLESGQEEDLEQLRLSIFSPEHRLRVVDFCPRTELHSELASDVEINSTAETNKSLNVAPSGQYGPLHVQVAAGGGLGVSQNQGSKESYHRLAPKQVLVASGTTHAEHGVFFKWRKSSQVTLEGAREATCRFAVPGEWRADWIQVHCEVVGTNRNYLGDKVETCGQADRLVGLHLAGDDDAYRAARLLGESPAATLAAHTAGESGTRHVVQRPVSEAEPKNSREWFGLPSIFKLCNHGPAEATRDTSEHDALALLRKMSGE